MSESLGSSLCSACKNICLTSLNLQQIVAQAALGGSGDVGLIFTILVTLFPDSITFVTSSFVASYAVLGGRVSCLIAG